MISEDYDQDYALILRFARTLTERSELETRLRSDDSYDGPPNKPETHDPIFGPEPYVLPARDRMFCKKWKHDRRIDEKFGSFGKYRWYLCLVGTLQNNHFWDLPKTWRPR